MEPLLEPVKLNSLKVDYDGRMNALLHSRIQWVIVGGESGKGARQMPKEWALDLRDQCLDFDVPFLFKQWGNFNADGADVGKKIAGRLLEGKTYDGYPV